MKNIIKLIITSIFIMIAAITISSCNNKKYDVNNTITLDSFFHSETGRLNAGTFNHSVKLTIKTGGYNYAGHFRIVYEEEEIFNSSEYDYFIPKGTTIYSKVLDAIYTYNYLNLKFELLDNNLKIDVNNSELEERGHIALNISQSEKVNYTDEYLSTKYKINSYEQTISKGYTYVLFDNDNVDDRDSIKYIQSQSHSFIFNEVKSYIEDCQGNGYGYFKIYGKNQFTLNSDDVIIHNANKCYNVYLSEINGDKLEFDVVVYGYLKVNFINVDTKKHWYRINYNYESLDREHIDNSKVIPEGEVVTSQTYNEYKPVFSAHSNDNTMYFWYNETQYKCKYDLDTMYTLEFPSENYYCKRTYHFEIS